MIEAAIRVESEKSEVRFINLALLPIIEIDLRAARFMKNILFLLLVLPFALNAQNEFPKDTSYRIIRGEQKRKKEFLAARYIIGSIGYSGVNQETMNHWLKSIGSPGLSYNYLEPRIELVTLKPDRFIVGIGANYRFSLNDPSAPSSNYKSVYLLVGYDLSVTKSRSVFMTASVGQGKAGINFHGDAPHQISFGVIDFDDRLRASTIAIESRLRMLFHKEHKCFSKNRFLVSGIDAGFLAFPHFKRWFYGHSVTVATSTKSFKGYRVPEGPTLNLYGFTINIVFGIGYK